jgi:predicted PurR-regulated permease PerM
VNTPHGTSRTKATSEPAPALSYEAGARYAHKVLISIALVAAALLAWELRNVLVLFFGAVVVATVLRVLSHPLCRYLRMPPRVALAVVVIGLVVGFSVLSWLIGDRVATQLDKLRATLPDAIAALSGWLNTTPIGVSILEWWQQIKDAGVPWARVAGVASVTMGAVGSTVLILILAVYLSAAPGLYQRGFVRLLPIASRDSMAEALQASGEGLSRWLIGQSISMLFVGTATAIGLALLGIPLALSLGLITGMLGFIPYFGTLAAGLLAIVVAFAQGPQQALHVTALFVVVQQIEGNVLMPFVQRWAVSLPPVLGLLSVVVFGLLFGLPGVLFATPLMVVVMILVQKLYIEALIEVPAAMEAAAQSGAGRSRQD